MATDFVHTFLFACSACGLPLAITRTSESTSWESVGNGPMRTYCGYCGKVCYCSSGTAKRRYVDEWQRTKEASQS